MACCGQGEGEVVPLAARASCLVLAACMTAASVCERCYVLLQSFFLIFVGRPRRRNCQSFGFIRRRVPATCTYFFDSLGPKASTASSNCCSACCSLEFFP